MCLTMVIYFAGLNLYAQAEGFYETPREKLCINAGWKFHLGELSQDPIGEEYDDSDWEDVNVPHTLKLTSLTLDDSEDDYFQKTFHRDLGWYRKKINIDFQESSNVFLEFEGAHQVTDLWVNGKHVGQHAISGYTPFHFDIREYLHPDKENTIVLKVDNRLNADVPPDGGRYDYIKFSGLYRDVYLVTTDRIYIPFAWENSNSGVSITTPTVKKSSATISVKTTVRNSYPDDRKISVLTRVVDEENHVVLKMKSTREVPAGSDVVFSQVNGITENVHLWSPDNPYLYRVNTTVFDGDQALDCVENPLGLRWFQFVLGQGFFLNGEVLELIGINRHQQYPYIGDALPNSFHWKDAVQLKEAGFNIIRLAHYPHDDAFIQACDKLGMLIYEEPPTWTTYGSKVFMDNLELATRIMIRNHRNHPSVLMWGASINHLGPVNRLHYAAKDEDPTRPTASNGHMWEGPQTSGVYDLYTPMEYSELPLPEGEFLFAMEHSDSPDAVENQHLISKYRGSPNRIGLTAWTAHDYFTFHNEHPDTENMTDHGSYSAFRMPKPVVYWYMSELTRTPMVHIADDRVSHNGEVLVFSNCDKLELFHNGVSLGTTTPRFDPRTQNLVSPPFIFDFEWTSGELLAHAYLEGKLAARHEIAKPLSADHLIIKADMENRVLQADGSDIVVVRAYVKDENNTTVTAFKGKIEFNVSGQAEIVDAPGVGANPIQPQRGMAPILIRASTVPGEITVTAKSKGFKNVSTTISSVEYNPDMIASNTLPIIETLRLKIDIGDDAQKIEHDNWVAWNKSSGTNYESNDLEFEITAMPGGEIEWLGTAGIAGYNGYMAGDGIHSVGSGLELKIAGLKPGNYLIKTYHHDREATRRERPEYSLILDDINGKNQLIRESVMVSYDRFSGRTGPASIKTNCSTDGKSEIILKIENDQGVVLNGFEIIEK